MNAKKPKQMPLLNKLPTGELVDPTTGEIVPRIKRPVTDAGSIPANAHARETRARAQALYFELRQKGLSHSTALSGVIDFVMSQFE